MDDFKKLTEQLFKIYINAESVNDLGIENYFDENISLIGTGKHEIFRNLHEFLESFEFDVKQRGKIRIEVQNLHQEEEQLGDDHVLAHGTVDFIGLFKDGSICFKMETRFTIIYRWMNGKWLVQHLHQSTPDLEQMDGEENSTGVSCIKYCLLSYLKVESENKEGRTCQKIPKDGLGY